MASQVFSCARRRSNKRGNGLHQQPVSEMDLDADVVGWDNQDDPDMPLNFPNVKKWVLVYSQALPLLHLLLPLSSRLVSLVLWLISTSLMM